MSYEPPTPPTELSADIVDILNGYSSKELQAAARYSEALSEYKERKSRLEEKSDDNEIEDRPDDLPTGIPSKASITVKTINDNRYYYWQWRDGDKIKSKYKGPVNSEE